MRCPDCGKFVSMENGDPQVNEVLVESCDFNPETLAVEVRLTANGDHTRNCADCGTELKSISFDSEEDVKFNLAECPEWKDLSLDQKKQAIAKLTGGEEWEALEDGSVADESGGGRYKPNEITITTEVSLELELPGDAKLTHAATLTAVNTAGSYDECC